MEVQNTNQVPEVVKSPAEVAKERLEIVVTKVTENYPLMLQKSNAAQLAMSKIKQVTNEAEDKLANDLLVKVRSTYQVVEPLRKEITTGLDNLKDYLMEPERKINPANSEGDYNRIKKLRDTFANQQAGAAKAAADKIKKDKDIESEKIRVKAALQKNIIDGSFKAIHSLSNTIVTYVSAMTLENWEERMKKFTMKPQLKQDVYESFFTVPYNANLLTQEVFKTIVDEVKAVETYEKVNTDYSKIADGTVTSWKQSLPDRKKELEKIAAASEEDAKALTATMHQTTQAAIESNNASIEAVKTEATDKVEQEHNEAAIVNDFNSHVEIQAVTTAAPKGSRKVRKAIVEAEDKDIVKFWSKILFNCYTNPKFDGHLKKKDGVPVKDENGVPEYNKWAQELLDFAAKNFLDSAKVEGLTIKEIISTTQKA